MRTVLRAKRVCRGVIRAIDPGGLCLGATAHVRFRVEKARRAPKATLVRPRNMDLPGTGKRARDAVLFRTCGHTARLHRIKGERMRGRQGWEKRESPPTTGSPLA
jgi:hypothetical protein